MEESLCERYRTEQMLSKTFYTIMKIPFKHTIITQEKVPLNKNHINLHKCM